MGQVINNFNLVYKTMIKGLLIIPFQIGFEIMKLPGTL